MNCDDSTACGDCRSCKREVALRIASYVVTKRFEQRRTYDRSDAKERQYVHRQVRKLLAMTGVEDEELVTTEELRRMEWGVAMRQRRARENI